MILDKCSPLYKEWKKLVKDEQTYLKKHMDKKESGLELLLENKVPDRLKYNLNGTFCTAFSTVFEEGTSAIEKTYSKDKMQREYQINECIVQNRGNRKALKNFSKKASASGNINLLLSGVSGISLGVLGIGIPDVVLFTALMLKGIYQIALNYGFDYNSSDEKRFILLIIQGALAHGTELKEINSELNHYMYYDKFKEKHIMDDCVRQASNFLASKVLYMKFIQGIPIIGAAGGAFDVICMKQVLKYAELKYRRRFYVKKLATIPGQTLENV